MAKKKRQAQVAAQAAKSQASGKIMSGFGAMEWHEKIVWACLHILLFMVPIAMGNLTFLGIGGGLPISFDQFDIVKLVIMRAATIVGLGAWVIGILLNGGRLRRTKIDWLILAFLGWVLLSSLFSIHIPTSIFGKYRRFEGLLSFINYAAVFFLVVQMSDRVARIRSLGRTLVLSSIVVTGYGLMQYAGRDIVQWGNLPFEATRSFATYGNPDLLGGFLVLAFPIALVMALSENSKVWRVIYWIATLMLSAVLITAFTRSAWVGTFMALIPLAIALWRAKIKTEPIDWGFAGISVLAVAAVIVRSFSSANEVLNFQKRVVSIFQFRGGSAASRFEIWEAAISAIQDRPIFGFGADTFRLIFPMFKTEAYVQQVGYLSVADNVHNYPLQLMSGIGIPGFLLLYGTIAYALVMSAGLSFVKGSGNSRLLQSGLWAAVVGYMFHLMFGLSVTGTTVIMWAVLGLVMAPTAWTVEIAGVRDTNRTWRTIASAAMLAAIFVGTWFNIQYFVADRYYLAGRVSPLGIEQRIAALKRAVELNPSNDMYRAEVGVQYQDAALQILMQADQDQAAGKDVQAQRQAAIEYVRLAEQAIKDTIEFVPPEYDNYVFLSSLYNFATEYLDPSYADKALEAARDGVKVEYYGPAIRLQLARALANKGQVAEAIEELKLAARMDPAYREVKLFLAQLLATQDPKQAREVLDELLLSNPNDAQALAILQQIGGEATSAP